MLTQPTLEDLSRALACGVCGAPAWAPCRKLPRGREAMRWIHRSRAQLTIGEARAKWERRSERGSAEQTNP